MKEVINIPALFSSVIAGMRDSGNVLSIVDQTGDSYLVSVSDVKSLEDGAYVSISGTANFGKESGYMISNVDSVNNTFTISETSGYASETGTYTANSPYFIYGHLDEIQAELQRKNQAPNYAAQKYPLIILAMDMEESEFENRGFYCRINPTFILCSVTSGTYTSQERHSNVIVPVLYPILKKLINAIADSRYFAESKSHEIDKSKTDRLYWGTIAARGNSANKMPDYIDAVELNISGLTVQNTVLNCDF